MKVAPHSLPSFGSCGKDVQEYTNEVGAKDGADVRSMLWSRRYEVGFGCEEDYLVQNTEKKAEE